MTALPRLDDATVCAYLARLGHPAVSVDLQGLSRLRKAHLLALPFHNLGLLANEGRESGVPSIEASVVGNIAGLGGTRLQLTPPFVALLRALGFDAWLTEEAVGAVRLPEGRFAVDVAPEESGPTGPGLGSIQAARRSEWAWVSVRGALYQRVAGGLTTTRPVVGWAAMAELLHSTFGLPEDLIARALQVLRRRMPDLLGEVVPPRAPLRFILSLAVTDRTDGVGALLRSVADTLERDRRPGDSVGVLLLDNGRTGQSGSALEAVLAEAWQRGLWVTRVEARNELGRLAPFQRCGLLPTPSSVPLPIGASRTLQACLLHEHLRTGALGLPFPGKGGGPVAVWMLDDDLSVQRLRETPEGFQVEPVGDLFSRAESLWLHHPEVSIVLGTCTGDPPIPGYATFHVQTRDLAGNLRMLADLSPEAPWTPRGSPRELPDYYYDHARGSSAHLQAVFSWTPPGRAPWTVREAFRTLCAAFTRVPHGQQVTRPLTHGPVGHLVPSRHRGGNALFFDLDALVAAPYPVLRGVDGVVTRRADTLWAHLIAREPLIRLVQADLDLMHGRRDGDGSSPLAEQQPDPLALRGFVEGQERGVVLARLLEREAAMETADAEREVAARRGLLARGQEGVRQVIAEARGVLAHPEAWWWREEGDAVSARACLDALTRLETLARAVDALEDPALPERLADFARHVVSSLPDWRSAWG
ncbi:hypothetical protein [Archangium violaceum]|uniref:Uncharacterized protein n=1 Tax=Archangium violaceum Cb vi76 TaxID=1406225 RepID=A0A084SPS4_9BACT|nr:hypothetical protein [Archangium violaceum]KFA90459.1 hypothetical protein Q664_28110 [Archangium violaceum Cb vi76]